MVGRPRTKLLVPRKFTMPTGTRATQEMFLIGCLAVNKHNNKAFTGCWSSTTVETTKWVPDPDLSKDTVGFGMTCPPPLDAQNNGVPQFKQVDHKKVVVIGDENLVRDGGIAVIGEATHQFNLEIRRIAGEKTAQWDDKAVDSTKQKQALVNKGLDALHAFIAREGLTVSMNTRNTINSCPRGFVFPFPGPCGVLNTRLRNLLHGQMDSVKYSPEQPHKKYLTKAGVDPAEQYREITPDRRTRGINSIKRGNKPLPNPQSEKFRQLILEMRAKGEPTSRDSPDRFCQVEGCENPIKERLNPNCEWKPRNTYLWVGEERLLVCSNCIQAEKCCHGARVYRCPTCSTCKCPHGITISHCKVCDFWSWVQRIRRNRRSNAIEALMEQGRLPSEFNSSTTIGLLGCTVEEWMAHLHATWNERYLDKQCNTIEEVFGKYDVHIDEIVPCSKLPGAKNEPYLWHWKNSQVLLAIENLKKSNKILDSEIKAMREAIDEIEKEQGREIIEYRNPYADEHTNQRAYKFSEIEIDLDKKPAARPEKEADGNATEATVDTANIDATTTAAAASSMVAFAAATMPTTSSSMGASFSASNIDKENSAPAGTSFAPAKKKKRTQSVTKTTGKKQKQPSIFDFFGKK